MKTLIYSYLEESDLRPQTIEDNELRTLYKFGITLKNCNCNTFIDIRTDPKLVLISTYFPIIIPVEYRNTVAEFIIRTNRIFYIGSFDLDFDSGDLCIKTPFIYKDLNQENKEIFYTSLRISHHFMDKYMPGILSIIYSNIQPIDALNKIEDVNNPNLN